VGALELSKRLANQLLVGGQSVLPVKSGGDSPDGGFAVATMPNERRRWVKAMRLVAFQVVDQRLPVQFLNDQVTSAGQGLHERLAQNQDLSEPHWQSWMQKLQDG
jgi:hypothetical protein